MALIHTTKGDLEESTLIKTEGLIDNENEKTTWVEYRLPGNDEIIHRSAHVALKKNVTLNSQIEGFANE